MRTLLFAALLPVALTGCLDLDGFVFNPIHCSTVGADTCEDSQYDNVWDRACVPCEAEYDWAIDYPWIDGTLDDGVPTVRPIETTVVREALPTDDGEAELDTYFIPSHGEVPELSGVTVLYNHGNFMGIEHYQVRLRFLHELGVNVWAWDYRGYGKSMPEGAPSSEQFLADAHQVLAHARTVVPDPDRIVVYANSLGGIPAVEMSLDSPPCALMLEAAFTSMSSISRSNGTVSFQESFFSQNRFDNLTKIADYDGPLLVMAGDEDNFFALEDQQSLHDNAGSERKRMWVVPGAKHGISNGGVPEAGLTPYFAEIRGFLDDVAPECLSAPAIGR